MELIQFKNVSRAKTPKILVVEDDLELSLVIEKVLRSIDNTLHLDWATSAEAAIEHLERNLVDESSRPYDLIIADIFLDGRSTGIDFWRTSQELFPNTPVLITSALSLDRFFSTIGTESISPPYLQKPFTLGECKQALETMLKYSARGSWVM
jgi:CheY-like chemotaxis protein